MLSKIVTPDSSGFFSKLKNCLIKTRQNLGSGLIRFLHGRKINDDIFEKIEEQLLIADIGVETTYKIINNLNYKVKRDQIKNSEELYHELRVNMESILNKVEHPPLEVFGKTPFIILVVGVNGAGKTTTIGKIAHQYSSKGKKVMLAAGDTFRAAAIEQLQIWGLDNGIPVISQQKNSDPASVIFNAIKTAKSSSTDILIADTAGRLHNKLYLMKELKKIIQVIKKIDINAPHEIMLILDATTGQNAIKQVNLFNDIAKITGITLTKLDGTAKGGIIFAIADRFSIPIRYIGIGEKIKDLQSFKASSFIEALFIQES